MSPAILPIVEGKSEVNGGIRCLLERIIYEGMTATDVQIATPFRVKRYHVVKAGKLEAAIKTSLRSRAEKGFDVAAIIVLLDGDDDCPVHLAADLNERAAGTTPISTAVVLAEKAIECWILGAKESVRGMCRIRDDATAPENPEAIRYPKYHLSQNMVGNLRYNETDELPKLLARMDLEQCQQRCRSFRKFVKEVKMLIERMTTL